MVFAAYRKGKQLMQLEKLKKDIKNNVDFSKYDYSYRYKVGYKVSLEITPHTSRLKDKENINKDMLSIQQYLLTRGIAFSFTNWGNFIRLDIEDNYK
jgi:hypothetical protein